MTTDPDAPRVIACRLPVPTGANFNDRQALKAKALREMREKAQAEGYNRLVDVRVKITRAPYSLEHTDGRRLVMTVEATALKPATGLIL
jgi:hypothetical protein